MTYDPENVFRLNQNIPPHEQGLLSIGIRTPIQSFGDGRCRASGFQQKGGDPVIELNFFRGDRVAVMDEVPTLAPSRVASISRVRSRGAVGLAMTLKCTSSRHAWLMKNHTPHLATRRRRECSRRTDVA